METPPAGWDIAVLRLHEGWLRSSLFGCVLLCLLGSALRVFLAFAQRFWLEAPDQIAWELLIKESLVHGLRADQVWHYPHEGGSVISGLVARTFFAHSTEPPPLTGASLAVDFLGRLVAALAIRHAIAPSAGLWFSALMAIGVPGLLPWSIVSYGQHGLASFFPVLVCSLLSSPGRGQASAALAGLFVGLALAFSLDSLVLVPVFLLALWLEVRARRNRHAAIMLAAMLSVVLVAVLVRVTTDFGFHLVPAGLFSIRGETNLLQSHVNVVRRLWEFVTVTAPAGFWMFPTGKSVAVGLAGLYWALVVSGWIMAFRHPVTRRAAILAGIALLTFVVFYCFSFVYVGKPVRGHYVMYRHVAYVWPLTLFIITLGVYRSWRASVPVLCLLVGCFVVAQQARPPEAAPRRAQYLEAGWGLGRKLGHDPVRLGRLLALAPSAGRKELTMGVGWGMTATIMNEGGGTPEERADQLVGLVRRFEPVLWDDVNAGMRVAFEPDARPALPPAWLSLIEAKSADRRLLP